MLRELNLNEMEIVSGGHFNEDPTPDVFGGGYQRSASDILGADAGWIQGGVGCPPCVAAAVWIAGGAAVGGGGSASGFLLGSVTAHIGAAGTGSPDLETGAQTVMYNAIGGAVSGPHPGTFFGSTVVGFLSGYHSYNSSSSSGGRSGTVTIEEV